MSGFLDTHIETVSCEDSTVYHRFIDKAQKISFYLNFYWLSCHLDFIMDRPSETRGTANRRSSNSLSRPSGVRGPRTSGNRIQEPPELQNLINDILRRVRNTQHKGLTKRLASFAVFPQNTSFSRVELAKLGYIFNLKRIECSFCGFKTKTVSADIVFYHKKFRPQCDVVRLHMQSVASNNGEDWPMSDDQYAMKKESHFSTRLENESDRIATKVELETSKWRFEFERLNSFAEQKMEHFQILAKSGFYLPEKERVQCYACGFSIIPTAWQTVFELHSVKSTGCPFLNGKASNVPLEQQSEPKLLSSIDDAPSPSRTRGRDSDDEEETNDEPQQRILDGGFFSRLITFRLATEIFGKILQLLST
ncbi:uncharacterized protein LOC142343193 isoform X2 [Convolutriloba macropyga]|uniref:uncharacterized protein LOC142343193 isoform X2 n=1 Tax=Convolutriloba macropyga TaxID=536237 RepID=UPI003F523C47